jgi:hypothetical protein
MGAPLRRCRETLSPSTDRSKCTPSASTPSIARVYTSTPNTDRGPSRQCTEVTSKDTTPKQYRLQSATHSKVAHSLQSATHSKVAHSLQSATQAEVAPRATQGRIPQPSTAWSKTKQSRKKRRNLHLTEYEEVCTSKPSVISSFNSKFSTWYILWVLLSTNTLCALTHHSDNLTKTIPYILHCPTSTSLSSPLNQQCTLHNLTTSNALPEWPPTRRQGAPYNTHSPPPLTHHNTTHKAVSKTTCAYHTLNPTKRIHKFKHTHAKKLPAHTEHRCFELSRLISQNLLHRILAESLASCHTQSHRPPHPPKPGPATTYPTLPIHPPHPLIQPRFLPQCSHRPRHSQTNTDPYTPPPSSPP